jgi:uncharacterized membrane protein YcaP (DUF421 family)
MPSLSEIFGSGPSLTLPQEIARAILIFFYVLILLRLAGPRTLAKLSALDVVGSMIVGSSLSRALTGNTPLSGTLAAIAVFVTLHWLITQGAARSGVLSRWFEGKPVELAADGRMMSDTMRARGISKTGFEEALRQAGLADFRKAQQVTLEPSGKITVCPRG